MLILSVRWPTSDNLHPHKPTIQRHHNDMTTTSQRHHNNTTTTTQRHYNNITTTWQRHDNDITTSQPQHNHNTTTPQFFWNKLRAVAAKTVWSCCKVVSIRYVNYFRAYQRQMTLYNGVGVITKLYFAIFAAIKESMTLNLAQSSFKPFKVIYLSAIESQCTTLYRPLAFALSSTDSEILPALYIRAIFKYISK